ncbi:hypothetical protein ACPC54_26830 [Kitasatospora sp. NPDC094028]
MANQAPTFAFRTEDLTVDSDGKVRIQDPDLSRAVTAAMAAQPNPAQQPTANNCHGGNCAKGCGTSVGEM